MSWWQSLWIQQTADWIYAPLSPEQTLDKCAPRMIVNDQYYLSIFLRSMRIANVREGLAKLHGAVHSYAALPGLSGAANFQTIVAPTVLSDVDSRHLDYVIMINHRLLGPVPYRGGDLRLEVGLFSVKSSDLTRPFLSLLERLAKAAGVAFIGSAQPFVDPLLQGINMLVGAQDGNPLEIGLARTFDKVETGHLLVMRAKKGTVDLSSLRLDTDYRLIDRSGQSVGQHSYMVLGFEAAQQRDDWFEIRELVDSYHVLRGEIRRDKLPAIREAWATFQRVARTCPDLIEQDAERLIGKVQSLVDIVLAPTPTSAGHAELPEFAGLDLYGQRAQGPS